MIDGNWRLPRLVDKATRPTNRAIPRALIPYLVVAGLSVLRADPSQAQIPVVKQHRSVVARAILSCAEEGSEASASTEGDGEFVESVREQMSGAEANANGGVCIAPGDSVESTASQDSVMIGAFVRGSGTATAGKGGAIEGGSAAGASRLFIELQLTAPTPYRMFGHVDGLMAFPGMFFAGEAWVSLKQGDETIHHIVPHQPNVAGEDTYHSFSFSGMLSPGTYTLEAFAEATHSGSLESGSRSEFDVTFVPEPSPLWCTFIGAAGGMVTCRCRPAKPKT